jgi:predicted nucleic acid-binding protein
VKAVFLDTVGLIARWDKSDQWHGAARQAFEALPQQEVPAYSTTFVFLECGNAAARQPYRRAVDRLRLELEGSGRLIVPTEADWRTAWTAYARGEANEAGIVDQVSFTLMRRLGLTHAFTNDRHFRAAGFTVLF